MHEALHAFMDYANIDPALQHDVMLKYVTTMGASLQQMFPNLSSDVAQNLALGGLQVSPFFETIKGELNLKSGFDAVQSAYSIGSLGTRCN